MPDIDSDDGTCIVSQSRERHDMPLPVKPQGVLLYIEKNLLLLMIAIALVLAIVAPGPGITMKTLGFSGPITFLVFLLQGMSIDLKNFARGGRIIPLFLWGFLLAYVLAPLLGCAASAAFGLRNDDLVGFLLMCSMTPTIASGVILSGRAGGERTTAVALTAVLMLIGMLVIPFTLNILLSRAVALRVSDLVRQLVLTVLVPAVLGQAIRLIFPALMDLAAIRRLDKDAPAVLIGLTIYISLAPQADKLQGVSAAPHGPVFPNTSFPGLALAHSSISLKVLYGASGLANRIVGL